MRAQSLGCWLLLASAAAAADQPSRRITADVVKARGLELVKTVLADIDGDGKKDLVGVGLSEKGLQLISFSEDAQGAVIRDILPPAGGREIARFEAKPLVPPLASQEIILEVYDENPDDKVKRIRVYAAHEGKLKEVFSNVLHRPKNTAERPEWERDTSIVQYGEMRGGWYPEDLQGDGVVEFLVRRKPQLVQVPAATDGVVKIITGVREEVFAWDDALVAYKSRGERLLDFIPALNIAKVSASSTWIEPKELKQLRADALAAALNNADGAEAKPEDKKEAKGKEAKGVKGKEPEGEDGSIDRSPYTQRLVDKDLSTAWIEDAKGDGKGEWVEVELAEEAVIHMVRVVTGCVDTKATFKNHNVPTSFTLQLDGGSESVVNRREPGKFDPPAIAFGDDLVKIPERPWARTTLVFLDGKTSAKKIKLTLNEVASQGKKGLACISEVSVH
jgi:hypothetical protein